MGSLHENNGQGETLLKGSFPIKTRINRDFLRFSFDVVSLGNILKNGRNFLACCVFPNFHQLVTCNV